MAFEVGGHARHNLSMICRKTWTEPTIEVINRLHFKRKCHTPANILVPPVEKITYDANSTSRFKIIKRHETELKWIKLLQTPYPPGFNDNIYHEGNLSKMPDFDVFSLLEFRKRTARSHGIKKN